MALNTLPAGAFADDAISSDKINLANNFAFTGTVTGTPQTLVKTGSLTSTTDAPDYNIDSVFSATYLNYFVTFKFAIAGNGNNCQFRFRTGGSSNTSANYQTMIRFGAQDASLSQTHGANGTSAQFAADLRSLDSQGMQGFMYIFNPFSSSTYTMVTAHYNSKASSGAKRMHYGGLMFDDTTSFDGFQLSANTGNGSTVDIQVYGIKE
jgi:hypothetical protein